MTIRDVEELADMLSSFTPDERRRIVAKNRELEKRQVGERKLYSLYPDEGPLRRDLYPKHIRFFAASGQHQIMPECPSDCDGSPHDQKAVIGANRSGKSYCLCYELVCHMIGWYPSWWPGRRWDRTVTAWAAGEDAKAVRESLQYNLLGPPGAFGTGLIPRESIVATSTRQGISDSVDTITVKTSWGGTSRCILKSYDQGRESYQGAKIDIMGFDEEPPMSVYSEGATRCLSTVPGEPNGLVMCAFTPLLGLSDVVLSYIPGGKPKVT